MNRRSDENCWAACWVVVMDYNFDGLSAVTWSIRLRSFCCASFTTRVFSPPITGIEKKGMSLESCWAPVNDTCKNSHSSNRSLTLGRVQSLTHVPWSRISIGVIHRKGLSSNLTNHQGRIQQYYIYFDHGTCQSVCSHSSLTPVFNFSFAVTDFTNKPIT